jgi:predicted secreted protein
MEFKDNRGSRIVFVGNCILNQNARFPGIAIKEGAFTEFVDILLRNGVGIEQLPCLECLGWGGVSRKTYYKFQPMVLHFVDKKAFPIIKLFFHISTGYVERKQPELFREFRIIRIMAIKY